MNVKELFGKAENGTLTFEQFEALAKETNAKFADLNEGNYVSKHKYEDELGAKAKEIETLNNTIGKRDKDLSELQKQLDEAGDGIVRLDELNGALKDLQSKYDADMKAYKEQIEQQSYEFAVKEFANTKNFTSAAAKRDFIQQMLNDGLKMDKKGNIIGAEDFAKSYLEDNADAFVVDKAAEMDKTSMDSQISSPSVTKPQPQFISSTPGTVAAKPQSLTEMMIAANSNPGLNIN